MKKIILTIAITIAVLTALNFGLKASYWYIFTGSLKYLEIRVQTSIEHRLILSNENGWRLRLLDY